MWQWWAPELWRRFTIALRRSAGSAARRRLDRLGDVASLQYAKVAEYQVRGAVHFHALIRLDGPPDANGFAPAPDQVTAGVLATVVEQVAAEVTFLADPITPDSTPRVLAFGAQVDTRVVRASRRTDDPNAPLTGEQVAGYLAKYATKSATDTQARDNPTCAACTPPPETSPPRRAPPTTPPARTGSWAGGRTPWASAATSQPSPTATP